MKNYMEIQAEISNLMKQLDRGQIEPAPLFERLTRMSHVSNEMDKFNLMLSMTVTYAESDDVYEPFQKLLKGVLDIEGATLQKLFVSGQPDELGIIKTTLKMPSGLYMSDYYYVVGQTSNKEMEFIPA